MRAHAPRIVPLSFPDRPVDANFRAARRVSTSPDVRNLTRVVGPALPAYNGRVQIPLNLTLQTIAGKDVPVPDPSGRFVHLQFRRFSGCPICNTHLRSLVKHRAKLTDHSIREVIFFHSSATELRIYEADIPFDLVADPERKYYRQF